MRDPYAVAKPKPSAQSPASPERRVPPPPPPPRKKTPPPTVEIDQSWERPVEAKPPERIGLGLKPPAPNGEFRPPPRRASTNIDGGGSRASMAVCECRLLRPGVGKAKLPRSESLQDPSQMRQMLEGEIGSDRFGEAYQVRSCNGA